MTRVLKVKKVNIISNDFPQLRVGESRSIYILDTMESHGKNYVYILIYVS